MHRSAALLVSSSVFAMAPAAAHAMDGVVASIKPVHSLVAAVMEGVGEPALLVVGAGSPHTYSMRPSQAAALQDARLVFWIGAGMETFLSGPLETLADGATRVALEHADGLTLLEYREGGAFEAHGHDEAGHDGAGHDEAAHEEAGHAEHADDHHAAGDGDDHAHEDDHEAHGGHADHEEHGEEAHRHEEGGDHAGHDHSGYDMHIWLDPENAKAMVGAIEAALSQADPDNEDAYGANAEALIAELDALTEEITARLAPVADRPFVVFHDAYHYFEERFGLVFEILDRVYLALRTGGGRRHHHQPRGRAGRRADRRNAGDGART